MWTGSVSPVIRQKAKGRRPARNLARRAERRQVLPGYPVEPLAFTLDQVRAYYSGDKIVCLRCGKAYNKLGLHIRKIHGMTDEAYKSMYGLPWVRGLTSSASHEKISEAVLGHTDKVELAERAVHARAKRTGKRKPSQPFRREQNQINLAKNQTG